MNTVSVQQVMAVLHRKFHIDMDYYEVLENCAEVLKKTAFMPLSRKQEIYPVSDYCVKLPPEAYVVKSAVQLEPYTLQNNVVLQDIYHPPLETVKNEVITVNASDLTEVPAASEEIKLQVPGTPKGPWVDFTWDCPYVRFNFTDFTVFIEYTALAVDAEGVPLIPEEALNMCVNYNVYTYAQPGFLTGRIPQYILKEVEQWKNTSINQAKNKKAFRELSRNEHSKLLDIFTSMDRKRTNIDS